MIEPAQVRRWVAGAARSSTTAPATLCTLLVDERAPGAPFGTPVPFAVLDDGRPVIVVSSLAVHTHNLRADPRASLVVVEGPAQGWRVTLVGRFVEARGDDAAAARAAHEALHGSFGLPGFFPFVLDVDHARVVAGFGQQAWLTGADVTGPSR